jgi:hypothetical protein
LSLRRKEVIRLDVRVADCPTCGSPARPAGNTAYCPSCGWNRFDAAENIRQNLLALPLVFLAFFILSLLTRRWLGILLFSGLCCLWTLGTGLRLVLQRRILSRTQTSATAESATAAGAASEQPFEYVVPTRFSHFSTLPVPRKLRMKRVFRWLTILFGIIALAFTDVSYSLLVPPYTAPDDPHWGIRFGFLTLVIYCALFGGWWIERRRKRLLRSGQVRFALVMNSNAGSGALLPGVIYRFRTEDGKQFEGFDQDWTDSYHQGMVVPVFHDSALPENSVAMCASFYDVV